MPTSIYKPLNFGDLKPTRMTIQLANRSVVQPLGVLEDVLVHVDELIFPADFYMLDMEDEKLGKGSTLILGRPFLMTSKTKIDVHAGTLSMEFGDTLVQFNIFEAMKHPIEDHSLFGIDLIGELVEDCLQLDNNSEAESISDNQCKNHVPSGSDFSAKQRAESDPNQTRGNSISAKRIRPQQPKAEIMSAHLVPSPIQVGQTDPKESNDNSSSPPPPMELKPLPSHLKYAYLDVKQQLSEQEDKLLSILRQHKKAIGWKLSDLLGINPSICMHGILMEEEAKPIRKQQQRMNLTILDVVKKEVTKLLATRIIYPISYCQWMSSM
ncbi:hypothetical protein CR513_41698, partial [Mucuna pruriens]